MTEPTEQHKAEAREREIAHWNIISNDCSNDCMARMEPADNGLWVQALDHQTVLASRDAEVREVLEGLRLDDDGCWCIHFGSEYHTDACLATRALWDHVNLTESTD